MEQNIVSMREIQRNYKKLLEDARRKRAPVFLGAHGRVRAVLMDINVFERLQGEKKRKKGEKEWEILRRELNALAREGKQGVNLAQSIREDRRAH